jgi:hypothetical protein
MLLWSLRMWPKAQRLARALEIPPSAWDIPWFFVAVGGPELSVLEAFDRPNLGGLLSRFQALSAPLSAAAYDDPWVRDTLAPVGGLALVYHPGTDVKTVRSLSQKDGYSVHTMDAVLTPLGRRPDDSDGLLDQQSERCRNWLKGGKQPLDETLALPLWSKNHHAAAFYLLECANWSSLVLKLERRPLVREALLALVLDELAHPHMVRRLLAAMATPKLGWGLSESQQAKAQEILDVRRP